MQSASTCTILRNFNIFYCKIYELTSANASLRRVVRNRNFQLKCKIAYAYFLYAVHRK